MITDLLARKDALNAELTHSNREKDALNQELTQSIRELDALNLELKLANTTKDRLFAILGHDLRTPLASVMSSLDLIASGETAYEMLKRENVFLRLQGVVAGSMDLLDNLLFWAKSRTGELILRANPFPLLETIRPEIEFSRKLSAIKGISLNDQLSEDVTLMGDPRIVKVILRNILSNAIKFTGINGLILITGVRENNRMRLTITDDGIGMTEDQLSAISQSQLDAVGHGTIGEKGTGFGLQMCRTMLEEYQGSMTITSTAGIGTSVAFTLPIWNAAEPTEKPILD